MTTTGGGGARRGHASRISSLDGLRGAAALVVLIHHCLLTIPALADPADDAQSLADTGSAAWWLRYTPLHAVWAGGEAVYVFFVLSGLVLTLPALQARFRWRVYYPQRLVRLYLPVFVAVLFGVFMLIIFPRSGQAGLGFWLSNVPASREPTAVLADAFLLTGTDSIVGPLWSLRWELVFSLLLPLYIGTLVVLRKWPLALTGLAAVGAVVVAGVGDYFQMGALLYLPMFAIGVLMASRMQDLQQLSGRFRPWAWSALTTLGMLMLIGSWILTPWVPDVLRPITSGVAPALGAGLVVAAAAFNPQLRRLLHTRAMQWLGMVSFSLYLVHEPIVIALAITFPSHRPATIAGSVVLSLLAAWTFFRSVEAPTLKLSRMVGQSVRSRITQQT